jgi:23S rRNA C2498 (ribose-2'-O)-methylase RlmM
MVCDVIATPKNTERIIRSWLSKKLCTNFCVTVKFKGAPEIATLLEIASFAKQNTTWLAGRQLTHNKNELTICGRL